MNKIILLSTTSLIASVLIQPLYADTQPINALVGQMFPLNASQIEQVKTDISDRQRAASSIPAMVDAQGISRVLITSTDPSQPFSPPNVRLGIGVVSSLVFTDASGNIWPISSYVIGDSQDFTVSWDKQGGVMTLQAKKPYAQSNMAVILKGLAVPVTLTLMSTQKQWDYLDYIRVQDFKDANEKKMGSLAHLDYLINLLHGIAPDSAKKLNSSSDNVSVWAYQGNYLIVTHGTLISPQWKNHTQDNASINVNAYEISPSPIILVSTDTGLQKITISEQ